MNLSQLSLNAGMRLANMTTSLRLALANHFPQLGLVRRWFRAQLDARISIRSSYSQHGEDKFIFDELSRYDLSHSLYVDVGANHPTSLSNTYLLYRQGLHGVVIEPNQELLRLHHMIRTRDIGIGVGCGSQASLGKFQVMSTPVLSSFATQESGQHKTENTRVWRIEYLPILPLDMILTTVEYRWISLLSIDTEGYDYQVLVGAEKIIEKVLWVCVEIDDSVSENAIVNFLHQHGFTVQKRFGCNLLAVNEDDAFKSYLRS
jgi:FkbM family methyltransferase